MRKTAGTLEQQRNRIKREYKRGRLATKEVTGDESLSEVEREIKQTICCYLKAQDFSYTYMAEAVGVSRKTINAWFNDESLALPAKVLSIREDLIGGAIKLMKTYLIEVVETLMEIMRTTDNEELAVKIGLEMMDRLGISKVNKSESVSSAELRQRSEIDITDKSGLLEVAKNAPPHVQARMAEAMDNLIALGNEYAGTGK